MYSSNSAAAVNRRKHGTSLATCCLCILALPILGVLVSGTCSIAEAQGGREWSLPGVLFDTYSAPGEVVNVGTSLVAGQSGAVHLVWLSLPEGHGSEGAYYYSRWDGESWTTPVDIFVYTSGLELGWPVLVPAPDGRLHIFWCAWHKVVHSWAWAASADSARAWASPDVVAEVEDSTSDGMDAKLDTSGTFHVVYATGPGDVYYARSDDGARTWSPGVAVSQVAADTATYVPKLDVAADGRIHVVWTEYKVREDPVHSTGLYYAHSVDNGLSWSTPVQLGGFAHSDANVLAVGASTVYVAWNGGVFAGGGRFFCRSSDGGVTWYSTIEFSEGSGLPSYPSLSLDAGDTLHILTGGGEYITWAQAFFSSQWIQPRMDIGGERSRLVLVGGNQLVAVFGSNDGIVYYRTRQLDVPAIPTVLPSTLTPPSPPTATPSQAPAPLEVAAATPTLSMVVDFEKSQPVSSEHAIAYAVAISSGLSLVVVGLVVCLQIRRKKP